MKKTRRTSRVGENVRDALAEVLRYDLKDVNIGISSITGVDVSPDLQYARVYVSGLTEQEGQDAVRALQHVRGKVRHFLGKRIRLRYTPELEFKYDESPIRGGRIEDLLQQVMTKDEGDRGGEGDRGDDSDED